MAIHVNKMNARFLLFSSWSYIVENPASNQACMIDPSWDPAGLFEIIERKQLTVEAVLLTHSHLYGMPVGQTLGEIRKDNIYFNFTNMEQFVKFRMRSNQRHLFDFI
jgi:hypothetical protein